MKTTAAEFKRNPQKHYRAADKGEIVTINHDRYRDVVFELTSRKRGNCSENINDFVAGKFIEIPEKGTYRILSICQEENKLYIDSENIFEPLHI